MTTLRGLPGLPRVDAVGVHTVDELDEWVRVLMDDKGITPIVYVMHPVGGDQVKNVRQALAWMQFLLRRWPSVAWIAPWIVDCHVLDDTDVEEREHGLLRAEATVGLADAGLALVRISTGMEREISVLLKSGGALVDATALGPAPPKPPRATPAGIGAL